MTSNRCQLNNLRGHIGNAGAPSLAHLANIMYQPITFGCLLAFCGFAVFIYFSPNQTKEHHFGYGLTKSGHQCRIVAYWNNGNADTQDQLLRTKEFLERNDPNVERPKPDEMQYDCFLDIDTEEYNLSNYTKIEQLSGFSEIITFKNRNESVECESYKYQVNCSYMDSRKKLHCTARGTCIKKDNACNCGALTVFLILGPCLLLVFIFSFAHLYNLQTV